MTSTGKTTRYLIEDWLPINEISIESIRERAAASALPPLNWLHVWWARRPLATSRGSSGRKLISFHRRPRGILRNYRNAPRFSPRATSIGRSQDEWGTPKRSILTTESFFATIHATAIGVATSKHDRAQASTTGCDRRRWFHSVRGSTARDKDHCQ